MERPEVTTMHVERHVWSQHPLSSLLVVKRSSGRGELEMTAPEKTTNTVRRLLRMQIFGRLQNIYC